MKPLVSYKFFNEIIKFIENYWYRKRNFYPGYFFVYPRLNQSLNRRFDYIIVGNNRYKFKRNMDDLLDRCFEQLGTSLDGKLSWYIDKISQVKVSFFVRIKKPRGKILNDDLNYLCDNVQRISENTYKKFAEHSIEFCYAFFPYFKLVKCYGNYHCHFVVLRRDYQHD